MQRRSITALRAQSDPLLYGTRHQSEDYLFVMMSAQMPDDLDDSPMSVSLNFENVSSDMVAAVRSGTDPAVVDFRLVYKSAPDVLAAEYTGLESTSARFTVDSVSVVFSRERQLSQYWPAPRMGMTTFRSLYVQ